MRLRPGRHLYRRFSARLGNVNKHRYTDALVWDEETEMRGERHNQRQNPEITALSCNLKRDRAAVCFPPDGVFMLGNEEYSFGENNFLEVRTVK